MTDEPTSLLEFPCDFPIKVMGRADVALDRTVLDVLRAHIGATAAPRLATRASSGGRYISVTVTITATSQEQLDGIYRELSAHEQVMMVL